MNESYVEKLRSGGSVLAVLGQQSWLLQGDGERARAKGGGGGGGGWREGGWGGAEDWLVFFRTTVWGDCPTLPHVSSYRRVELRFTHQQRRRGPDGTGVVLSGLERSPTFTPRVVKASGVSQSESELSSQ